MAPSKLLHDRHSINLFLDRDLHNYIRAASNLRTFEDKRSYSMTQCINELIAEAIAYREGGKDPVEAALVLQRKLESALGITSVDTVTEQKS
jgi:hypothetical protein